MVQVCIGKRQNNMKILVTGANGYIGQYVVHELLSRGHTVIATDITEPTEQFINVEFIQYDIEKLGTENLRELFKNPDAVIHLAWKGLPNYESPKHVENLEPQFNFLKRLYHNGVQNITVTGTCLEYGMREGMLREDFPCKPKAYYGVVKYELLQKLYSERIFVKWARLFYVYGWDKGILKAVSKHTEGVFKVTNCHKDFISIHETSNYLVRIAEAKYLTGIINVCSGRPQKVKDFVRTMCIQQAYEREIEDGYKMKFYEPKSSWGDTFKLKRL